MFRPGQISREYVARRGQFTAPTSLGIGPNGLVTPNGPFASGSWTPLNITETTGQTDPLGGTGASLLTDTATNAQHDSTQLYQEQAALTYQITIYIKPGTYTNNISIQAGAGVARIIGFDPVGHGAGNLAGMLPGTIATVPVANGFWRITGLYSGGTGGSANAIIGFGSNFPVYAGTLQNFTVWGFAIQPVYL